MERLKYYSLVGVKFIVTPNDMKLDLPLRYDGEVKIYENPQCLPRAFIARKILYADDWKKALRMLGDIDMRSDVVIEKKIEVGPGLAASGDGYVSIIEYTPAKIVLKAASDSSGVLVITDTFYPGWEAEVDGNKREVIRVNGFLRGVIIKKGESRIILRYLPKSFAIGITIAALCLICMICIFLCKFRAIPKS